MTVAREHSSPQSQDGGSVEDVIMEAWEAVSHLGDRVGAETQEAAFRLVLYAMLSRTDLETNLDDVIADVVPDEDRDPYEVRKPEDDDLFSTPQLRSGEIAAYLRIPASAVGNLYDVGERKPCIVIGRHLLSEAKLLAACEVGLLVTAGNTAVGVETTVSDVCEALAVYQEQDVESLVSQVLTEDDTSFCLVEGHERDVLRLTRTGVLAVRDLAARVSTS